MTCPATRPSSSSEKINAVGSSRQRKNASDTKLKGMVKVVAREAIAHHHPRLAKRVASRRKKRKVRSMIFFQVCPTRRRSANATRKVAAEGEKCQVEKKKMRDERCKMVPLRIDEDTGFNVYSEESLNLNRVVVGLTMPFRLRLLLLSTANFSTSVSKHTEPALILSCKLVILENGIRKTDI